MGASTRLKFPLPNPLRRHKKQPSDEVRSISAPMTNKAQKLLGTGEINIDTASSLSPASRHSKTWDTRSAASGASGISVTVSETTTASLSAIAEDAVTACPKGSARAVAWDQESDIIPKGLARAFSTNSAARAHNPDITTDASSLRRRGSGSTIVSFYDKTKLPLSISQQTSSSAMAKGLPGSRLDLEFPRPAPAPPAMHQRKPSRLDICKVSSSATSKMARLSQKGKDNVNLVLGSDLFTRSPSLVSTSPVMSIAGSEPTPRALRRKLTRESLRSYAVPRWRSFSSDPTSGYATHALRARSTDNENLNQLYQHYEQTSARDTFGHGGPHVDLITAHPSNVRPRVVLAAPTAARTGSRQSTSNNSTGHLASPSSGAVSWRPPVQASSAGDAPGLALENQRRLSVASSKYSSHTGDYAASISSRHTRTSRASKTAESFAEFDPNATSLLSLSSDSDVDEVADPAAQQRRSHPPSVKSRDSLSSPIDLRRRPSTSSSTSIESSRTQLRSRLRSSLCSQAPFLAIPEDEGDVAGSTSLTVDPRSSSMSSAITANSPRPSISTVASSVRSQSRLSQASMTTTESGPTHFSRPRPSSSPKQTPEVRHIAMQSRETTPTPRKQKAPRQHQEEHSNGLSVSPKRSRPAPLMGPGSMDFAINAEYIVATGPVFTLNDPSTAGGERLIAVTPQEAMLLSAMRAKRALMRENQTKGENKAVARDQAASKTESRSSVKTVRAPDQKLAPPSRSSHTRSRSSSSSNRKSSLAVHAPEQHRLSRSASTRERAAPQAVEIPEEPQEEVAEDIFACLDSITSSSSTGHLDDAEPKPDLSDFIIDFDAEQFPTPPTRASGTTKTTTTTTTKTTTTSHSRTSSVASAAGCLTHSKPAAAGAHHKKTTSFSRPRPDSAFLPHLPPAISVSEAAAPPLPVISKGLDLDALSGGSNKAERVSGDVLPRSASPVVHVQEEQRLELPSSSRMKALRISAVGMALPENGQWGDDG